MFTMTSVTTSFGFAETHEVTCWRYEVRVPPFWMAQDVWQTFMSLSFECLDVSYIHPTQLTEVAHV